MCEFISWKEFRNGDVFFLTDKDLKGKKFKEYKEYNTAWENDICGHGAIEYFYPELTGKGINKECTDFSSPKNFPVEIVKAIKDLEMTKFWAIPEMLLNDEGVAEYRKKEQTAFMKFLNIQQIAWSECLNIQQTAFWKLFKDKANRKKEWR